MTPRLGLLLGTSVFLMIASAGCATVPPDLEGLAHNDSRMINAPFLETWQATKAILRDRGYAIHTRDKRGLFVAYTDVRRKRLIPHRLQFTVSLDAVTAQSTRVTVEALSQKYGVTLLTYPGWHDLETGDLPEISALLEAVEAWALGRDQSADGDAKGVNG